MRFTRKIKTPTSPIKGGFEKIRSLDPERGVKSRKNNELIKNDIPDRAFERMDWFSEKGRSRLVTLKGKAEGGVEEVRTCTWYPHE